MYLEIRRRVTTLEAVYGFTQRAGHSRHDGSLRGTGSRPEALGRVFEPADALRGCMLVLTHRFWQDVLGSPSSLSALAVALDG